MDAQALGRYLRETREAQELTLEQAEQALRIRRRILESFELGDFNIPDIAAIQVRGFIRNYARYLGLDDERVVTYYEAALLDSTRPKRLSGRRGKRDTQPVAPVAPRKITDTPPALPPVTLAPSEPLRRGPSLAVILLRLLIGAAALAVIAFVVVQLMQPPATTPVPQGDILGQLPPTPSFTPPPPTLEQVVLSTAVPNLQPDFNGQGVLVTLTTTERTWLKITTDGTDQYEGIARPGTKLEYPATSTLTLVAANAQALDVIYNGQQQDSFGARGQMVTVVFTPKGVDISSGPGYAPTPINSPTPIPTPTDEAGTLIAQLTPSNTPGPSPTPSDTPTLTLTPSDTLIPTNTPTLTLTPSDTPIPTDTPSPTLTPTLTPIPTDTPIPSDTPIPTATAILPPRVIAPDATATKVGK